MDEPQPHRVEALALEAGDGLFRAVHGVPQDGVADVGHVDPDLVGASRLQTAAHMGAARVPGDDLTMGHRAAAVRHHRHFLPVHRMAADGGVHSAAVLFQVPHHHALVGPGQGVVLELGGELLVGIVVFRRDDEAGGVPVNAVDDTRPQFPADAGEGVPAVVEQGVDQRAVRVAGGRVDHQALGLVHHDDILILVDDVQRDVLGHHVHRFRVRQRDAHGLVPLEAGVFRGGTAAAGNLALLQQPGGGGAAHALQLSRQPRVQPGAGVLSRCFENPLFHGALPSCRIFRRTTGSRPPPAQRPPRCSSPPR